MGSSSIFRALVRALRLDTPDDSGLRALDTAGWKSLLHLADHAHLTLAMAVRCREAMPQWVRDRAGRDLANHALRTGRIRQAYSEIAAALDRAGVDFALLKGFSHDPGLPRPQYDIDILCEPEEAPRAQEAVMTLGYEPITAAGEFPADHLPLLIRKTGWRWRGDFFDPEQPPAVEIHFRLWDPSTERIEIEGLDTFWGRRISKTSGPLQFTALDDPDALAYASLHALRHLLRGDLLPWHIYEIAITLERRADDAAFWHEWDNRYDLWFRLLQSIAFRLARNWFGCRLHAMPPLPDAIEQWFETYGHTPSGPRGLADKSELWLHFALVQSRADAARIIRRRLLPSQKRRGLFHPHVRDSEATAGLRIERFARHTAFVVRRAFHHAMALPAAVGHGLFLWLRARGITPEFLKFLGAASLFNFGMTVFFLLYNLHLLKRGFHEDILGFITGAMTAGGIVGTLPAGLISSRLGLKRSLACAFALVPLISIVRTLSSGPAVLAAAAFAGGFAFSMYAVALAPVVAHLTPERGRPLAFSLVFSTGIGIGVLGSAAGGIMPEWLGGLEPALIAACVVAALSLIPASRLPATEPLARTPVLYPRSPAVKGYLGALAVWSLATGAFNPFFNVYFSTQLHLPVRSIGMVFSGSQLAQACAVLAAPIVLRRFGLPIGIMAMQMTAGLALGLLAFEPPLAGAAVLYASYMAFQYMSEPGLFSFLMSHASEEERGGASALNFLVLFAGQAIAASLSGMALRQFGNVAVLTAASLLAIAAGLCFRAALSRENPVLLERSVAR